MQALGPEADGEYLGSTDAANNTSSTPEPSVKNAAYYRKSLFQALHKVIAVIVVVLVVILARNY